MMKEKMLLTSDLHNVTSVLRPSRLEPEECRDFRKSDGDVLLKTKLV